MATAESILILREALTELYKVAWRARAQVHDLYNSTKEDPAKALQRNHLFDEKECWDATVFRLSEAMDYLLDAACFASQREQERAQ